MKKVLILLITLLLIATTFVTIANAKTNNTNIFFKNNRDGPILEFLKKIPIVNKTINFFKNLFGLAEDIENIEPPEEFDETYKVYYQDSNKEPGSEKPTDKSISVSIKNFDLDYSNKDNNVEFDMTFDGSTSGDVYACYYILVNYYEDGSAGYANVWMSPFKQSGLDLADYSFELTFTGTGSNGDDDWSTFSGRQYVNGPLNMSEIPFKIPEEDKDKTLIDVKLYVRAFSDEDLTRWNQDSISIMDEMTGSVYEETEDEDNNSIPGFEIMFLIIALSIALILMRRKKL